MDPIPVAKHVLDLPDELLDQVMTFLYTDNGSFTRDLIPISLTCRRLRGAAAPILFQTIHTRLTQRYVDRRTFNILLNLKKAPYDFAYHIRHIKQDDSFCFRENGCEDLSLSNEMVNQVVLQALRTLSNVKKISVGCLNSPLLRLLPDVFPSKNLMIIVEACACSAWTTGGRTHVQTLCESGNQHRFAFSTNSKFRHLPLEPWATYEPQKTLAVSWNRLTPLYTSTLASRRSTLGWFTSLQELHLQESNGTNIALDDLSKTLLIFTDLRRLSLVGPSLCSAGLSVINQMKTLESLRLNSALDRIFHAHLRNHDFEGLPYLRLPHLRSLEIRYISRYLSIEHVVPKTVKHLRIEYHNRNERLTSFDLRWIARTVPDLGCLEINIGALANLWHPTAIAGVDVDMEVYGTLEALSAFKHLRTLRLFPSYWESTAGYLHFVQPLADGQAVRLFNHLRLQTRSRLQMLIISNSHLDYRSRNEVFSRGLSEPMKWVVRPSGSGRILLSTHEAKKHYHLEQVWEGDRRLTMHTVRHSLARQLHFDELDGMWQLPMYEFPFDEPLPCHTQSTSSDHAST